MELNLDEFFKQAAEIQESLELGHAALKEQRDADTQCICDWFDYELSQVREKLAQLASNKVKMRETYSKFILLLDKKGVGCYYLKFKVATNNDLYVWVEFTYDYSKYGIHVDKDHLEVPEGYHNLSELPYEVLELLYQQKVYSRAEEYIVEGVKEYIKHQCEVNKKLGGR